MSAHRVRMIAITASLALGSVLALAAGHADAAQRPVHSAGTTAASGALDALSDATLPLTIVLPPRIPLGSPAIMRIQTARGASVEVEMTFPGGVNRLVSAQAGATGGLSLSLPTLTTLSVDDIVTVRVQTQAHSRHAFWQGAVSFGLPAPPSLTMTPLTARLTAGYHARLAIQTAPNATVQYSAGFVGAPALSAGTVLADAEGHAFVVLSTPSGIATPTTWWFNARSTTPSGSATSSASLVLVPRPALPVAVSVDTATVVAGRPETINVRSVALAHLGITIAYGGGAAERRFGQTDAAGRYSFVVATSPTQPRETHVTVSVHVLSGVDNGDGAATFAVRAAPSVSDYVKSLRRPTAGISAVDPRYAAGKVIMVSLQEQVLRAYENGKLQLFTYVTTGRPELPTVTGVYHIYAKVTPYEFHSPWPLGSRFYYPPTWIRYWMPFYEGYGLHDASWRYRYGPGTNTSGDGVASGEPTGTHGCVNIPFAAVQWLWNWAPVGTTVIVY